MTTPANVFRDAICGLLPGIFGHLLVDDAAVHLIYIFAELKADNTAVQDVRWMEQEGRWVSL